MQAFSVAANIDVYRAIMSSSAAKRKPAPMYMPAQKTTATIIRPVQKRYLIPTLTARGVRKCVPENVERKL
jgi:hypothetical protein